MLSTMKINNFKSILEATINFKELTILTGINSSGKSSIIQLLNIFNAATYGKQVYGHGTCDDLRCRYAKKNQHISARARLVSEYGEEIVELFVADGTFQQKSNLKKQYRLSIVSANRLGPQPSFYNPKGFSPHYVGERGEHVISYCQHNQDVQLGGDPRLHANADGDTFEYNLEAWMSEVCPGVRFFFETNDKMDAAAYSLGNKQDNTIQERPANVGFGISYTLPVVAQLLGAKAGEIVCIENPEAHLHPLGQTRLGDLVARTAAAGVQVIIETHSDHLIDGMRIAVVDGILNHSKVSVLYFTKNSENMTAYQHLEVMEDGDMTDWPSGFFDQSVKNLAKLARF